MNYNIKGTSIQISDEIRDYIEKKFSRVDKLLKRDTTAHTDIELQYQTSEDRQKFRAEFTLSSKDDIYRAESFGDTLHESIDLAVDDLNTELSRKQKKHLRHVRLGAVKFKEFIRGFRNRF